MATRDGVRSSPMLPKLSLPNNLSVNKLYSVDAAATRGDGKELEVIADVGCCVVEDAAPPPLGKVIVVAFVPDILFNVKSLPDIAAEV